MPEERLTAINQEQQLAPRKTLARRLFQPAILLILFCFAATSCSSTRVPVPPGEVPAPKKPTISDEQYGQEVLRELTKHYELDFTDPRLNQVTEVVERLTEAAGAQNDPWHVYLFRAPQVKNAAATRGNHVFIWSGMLDLTQTDEEIATVMAHEIAHVLAGHTEPDPNQEVYQMLINIGATAAAIAVAAAINDPNVGRNVGNLSGSLTKELAKGIVTNPYSRELEAEADHVGLFLMADAKYDPEAAVEFWRRAQQDPAFNSTIEFFSTHPLPEDRLGQLNQYLAEAKDRYLQAQGKRPKTKKPISKLPRVKPTRSPTPGGDSFDMGR